MDRRSRLWRRKSSEKSPGETESSGSMSSHSERFSDDQVDGVDIVLIKFNILPFDNWINQFYDILKIL